MEVWNQPQSWVASYKFVFLGCALKSRTREVIDRHGDVSLKVMGGFGGSQAYSDLAHQKGGKMDERSQEWASS